VAEDSPHRNLMLSSASGGQEAAAPGRLSTSCPAGSAAARAAAAIERSTALGCPRSLPGIEICKNTFFHDFLSLLGEGSPLGPLWRCYRPVLPPLVLSINLESL
jgi:hypothetical protein